MNKKIYEFIKNVYAYVLKIEIKILGVDRTKELDSRIRFNRKLNLKNPQTLADKISWLTLHNHSNSIVGCTDKWEVRKYVEKKGLSNILIPIEGGYILMLMM